MMKYLMILCLLFAVACSDSSPYPEETMTSSQPSPNQAEQPEARADAKRAWRLEERENWVEKVEIITLESAPPQFALKLTVTMPTPEWELTVDSVGKPDAQGRIRIDVTGTPPEGMVAQVLQSEEFTANLGSLNAGDLLVELYFRRGADGAYKRRGCVMLEAEGQ
jgi:hypothetical protein